MMNFWEEVKAWKHHGKHWVSTWKHDISRRPTGWFLITIDN
jgi:hypothetical protein